MSIRRLANSNRHTHEGLCLCGAFFAMCIQGVLVTPWCISRLSIAEDKTNCVSAYSAYGKEKMMLTIIKFHAGHYIHLNEVLFESWGDLRFKFAIKIQNHHFLES